VFHRDPTAVEREPAFRDGRLARTGPNDYAAYVVGRVWSWSPGVIHVPQGARVTFHVTSTDVLHGFQVQGTTVNVTAVPSIVGAVSYVFDRAGTY